MLEECSYLTINFTKYQILWGFHPSSYMIGSIRSFFSLSSLFWRFWRCEELTLLSRGAYPSATIEKGLFTYFKKTKLLTKVRKYIFQRKKNEVKNIQIIKVDQMIVFYNAMWSTNAHSCILGLFGGWFPHLY